MATCSIYHECHYSLLCGKANYGLTVQSKWRKRNKHARALTVRQAPSLKKWWEFRRSGKQKKLRTIHAFSSFPVSSNIFSSLMERWCNILVENKSYFVQINVKKVSKTLSFPRCAQEISVRREILSTNTLYILHIYKQTTEYISKRASQHAGGDLFSQQ